MSDQLRGKRNRILFTYLVLLALSPFLCDLSLPPETGFLYGSQSDQSEFQPLMDLIAETIQPDQWEAVGGPGPISSFDFTIACGIDPDTGEWVCTVRPKDRHPAPKKR